MVKVRVADSSIEGKGLLAVVAIAAGEPIFEPGQLGGGNQVVMTDEQFHAYISTVDRYSAVALGNGLHRVSLVYSEVDFGNHSCDPNMWLQGEVLVARRDIRPEEEVTSDYAMWTDSPDWQMLCNCGTALCRGVIRGRDWELPALQHAYAGHWPHFLAEKIRGA